MKKIVNTAIVGLGSRGMYFARLYSEKDHPGFKLTAMCDRDPKLIERAKAKFGTKIAYYTSTAEMVKDARIDAVLVTTNDPDHVEPTLTALEGGKHVLVEKPLCQDMDDARTIYAAVKRTGKVFAMGFELRECSVFKTTKRLISEGKIGTVKIGHCFDNVSVGGNYFFHRPQEQKHFFKSLLLQKGSHSMDLLNWFMGSAPVRVYGIGGRDFFGGTADPKLLCRDCDKSENCPFYIDHENFRSEYGAKSVSQDHCVWSSEMDLNDNSELCITYANGGKATFHECHFTPDYSREFWITGTKGKLYCYYDNPGRFLVRIEYTHDPQRRTEEFKPRKAGGAHGGGDNTLRDEFYNRIVACGPQTLAENADCILSGYNSTALAICAEQSIESGKVVDIPLLEA